jgi:Fe-S-cluster containining protein
MTEYEECEGCGGWCCASIELISITEDDIARIAAHLDISRETFREFYTTSYPIPTKAELEADLRALRFTKPCIFWIQGLCNIHEVKPRACAFYEPIPSCRWLTHQFCRSDAQGDTDPKAHFVYSLASKAFKGL